MPKMVILTEAKALELSKASSLRNIKNLNCWASDIDDLSLLKKLPNLEVLNLSVNHVSNLKDIAFCPKLKELYLRKNDLIDLCEIVYLKHLPCLKVLWLSENQCSMATNYKSTVIRNLPDLVKLDNCEINEEERRKSFLEGDDFQNPQNLPDFKKLDLSATLHESDVLRLYTTGNDIENQPSPYIISEEGNSSTSAENFSSSSNKNILSAVLLLMNELEHDDLKTLQIETQKKLNNYERKQDREVCYT